MLTLQGIARAMGGDVTGDQVRAPGPGHSAKDRSLSIKLGNGDDDLIVYSHAGDDHLACKDYVRSKLGLPPFNGTKTNGASKGKIVATYDYVDEAGVLLFQVVRFDPKDFRQRRPDGHDGWAWSMGETRRVPYRLDQLAEAVAARRLIFIAEGEKAVDALIKIGVPATCSPGGPGKWRKDYGQHFAGVHVVILPDNDEPGQKHAQQVAKSLSGVAAAVKVLALPGLPEKGDPFDWIEAGGAVKELWRLVEQADGGNAESSGGRQPLLLNEWLTRDLPEPDFLLGEFLSTTTRAIIVGPTGLGKTMFGLAVSISIASGQGFLHWRAWRSARVLFVDGEMSRRQMKRRLQDAVRRAGGKPEGLMVLSKEDHPDMPPLNTPNGQKWLDAFISKHGPFDLVIFDNIQALLVGDMKEEEQWAGVLPWVRDLTRRSIGQLWFHHTGHDETKSYGSKAREWQMDTVALMERVKDTDDDIAFTLKFDKARERNRDNRADFEPVTMSLRGDEWLHGQTSAKPKRLSATQRLAYDALVALAAKHGERLPPSHGFPVNIRAISVAAFRTELLTRGIIDKDGSNPRARYAEITNALKVSGHAAERAQRIWPILKTDGSQ